jgi:hypothetical protein
MKMLQNADNRLRVYLIWQPVLRSDDRASAENRAREFVNESVTHFWDGARFTGRLWQGVLDRKDLPWDVYLLYKADTYWETEPTAPDFWVRQLSGVNQTRFEARVKEMLSKTQ